MSIVTLIYAREGDVLFPEDARPTAFHPNWPPVFDSDVPVKVRWVSLSEVVIDLVVPDFHDGDFQRARDECDAEWFETGFLFLRTRHPTFVLHWSH